MIQRIRMPKHRRTRASIFHTILMIKLVALEIATTVVFFVWLYHSVMHEIGK